MADLGRNRSASAPLSDTVLPADLLETATVAVRACPGRTDLPAMMDQPMAEVVPFLWRDDLPQRHLHLFRLLYAVHQTDPVHQADTMGIRYDRRLPEHIPHDQVRALAPHPRELKELVELIRYLSAIVLL